MIKMTQIALLLLTQVGFAEGPTSHVEELEQTASFPYPVFFDYTDSYYDDEESEEDFDEELELSPTAQQDRLGNATVTVDVENTDFESQCKEQWGNIKKSHSKNDKKDEEEDHSLRAKFSIEWSSED